MNFISTLNELQLNTDELQLNTDELPLNTDELQLNTEELQLTLINFNSSLSFFEEERRKKKKKNKFQNLQFENLKNKVLYCTKYKLLLTGKLSGILTNKYLKILGK